MRQEIGKPLGGENVGELNWWSFNKYLAFFFWWLCKLDKDTNLYFFWFSVIAFLPFLCSFILPEHVILTTQWGTLPFTSTDNRLFIHHQPSQPHLPHSVPAGVHFRKQQISDTILDAGYRKCLEVTIDSNHDSSFKASEKVDQGRHIVSGYLKHLLVLNIYTCSTVPVLHLKACRGNITDHVCKRIKAVNKDSKFTFVLSTVATLGATWQPFVSALPKHRQIGAIEARWFLSFPTSSTARTPEVRQQHQFEFLFAYLFFPVERFIDVFWNSVLDALSFVTSVIFVVTTKL